MNYKKIFLGVLFFLGILSLSYGAKVGAASANLDKNKPGEAKAEVKAQRVEKFCDQIQSRLDKLKNEVTSREEKLRTRFEEREQNWEQNQSARDAKMAEFRSTRDSNLETHFAKMKSKAKTEDQTKAVNEFQAAVEKAIDARRTAIDNAIEVFRKGVDNIITARKTERYAHANTFRISVAEALEKAGTNCTAGSAASSIRTALKASLKNAKDELVSSKQSLEKGKATMETLIQARKKAIETANAEFKAAVEKARIEFKKTTGENTDMKDNVPDDGEV